MAPQTNYITGWKNTSIHDFLMEIDQPDHNIGKALVTCIDSGRDVAAMLDTSDSLRRMKRYSTAIGCGILVPTRQLLAAVRRKRIFFGFDEVWFFPLRGMGELTARPEGLSIVAPRRVDKDVAERFADWMRTSNCSLGLGDGEGMNYCCRVPHGLSYFVDLFTAQPRDLTYNENQPAA